MEGNVVAINYLEQRINTGVMLDEVGRIWVRVLTGDERLIIIKKNGDAKIFDTCPDGCRIDCYDGEYIVNADDLEEWSKRETAYEWLRKIRSV